MNKEEWKDIKGWEEYYKVSNFGRVKSLRRTVIYKTGKISVVEEKILKTSSKTKVYASISLARNGSFKSSPIHRLVAEEFVDKINANQTYVNHKNGNKLDNRSVNLEWCTPSENQYHSYRVLKNNPPRTWKGRFGKDHCTSKIVIRLYDGATYDSATIAAKENKCSFSGVAAVCRGTLNSIKGLKFKYA